ncbi:MAG: iron-containing alcohol dehydrogenase, partial [Litorivicinus sp.]
MQNFVYKNATEILFGAGQTANIAERIPADATVLMLYGGGSIKHNGAYDQALAALANHTVIEFGGVEANPTYETLMQALDVTRSYLIAHPEDTLDDHSAARFHTLLKRRA